MTTLKKGGVLQRAVSFISHLDSDLSEFQWHVLLSKVVAAELQSTGITMSCPSETFDQSPARSHRFRRLVSKAVGAQQPDMLFTFAGPSYISPECPELMGVADGWVTHSTPEAFRSIPKRMDRWQLYLASKYKLHWFKTARQYTVQTETARQGLAQRNATAEDDIYIIPNALAAWYENTSQVPTASDPERTTQILYFAAAYSHKRHDLLPDVCTSLRNRGLTNFRIVVTLPQDSQIWTDLSNDAKAKGVDDLIKNIGPLPVNQGFKLYQESDICFVPSILETFSATYLEAMVTKTPIVACDLNFAKEICGDAAVYFEPSSADHAAEQIVSLLQSPQLAQQVADAGIRQLAKFPNVSQQMQLYRTALHDFLATTRSV